jgi:glycosyltransferase involved in cell wall biosynthesis
MRILVLVDDSSDLEFRNRPDLIPTLMEANPRRDLAYVLPALDAQRVQLHLLAIAGDDSTALSKNGRLTRTNIRRLQQIVQSEDIELIHALGPQSMLLTALVGRMTEKPTLASIYDVAEIPAYNAAQRLWRRLRQRILRWGISRVVVPSELLKQNLWRLRYPESRIEVIYSGVELAAPDQSERVVLGLPQGPIATMVGRLQREQGYKTLIEALPRLLQRVPEAHIMVIGTGPMAHELHSHTRLMPIRWLGDTPDVRRIIGVSDVVVVHPRREGMPRAILEAGAAGVPVVASRVAGITEVIEHNYNGQLVTYEDSRDLAVQIGRVLSQPTFSHALGEAARKRVEERFTIDIQREQMTDLYESTVYSSR